MSKLPYIRGAAFYLFIYLFLGLIDSGIDYAVLKYFNPAFRIGLFILITLPILYIGFRYSVHIFFSKQVPEFRTVIAWVVQLFTFLIMALSIEFPLSRTIGNPKIFRILTVFTNFAAFFLTYWLSVKFFIEEKL